LESEKLDAGLKLIEEKAPWLEIINDTFTDQNEDMPSLPYLAGKDQLQAGRFTSLLLDTSIDIVWCLRGGYGSLRWLSMVPWDRIGHEAPVLIGFSDVSFLHSALFQQGHLSIHGPLISTLPITTEPAKKPYGHALIKENSPAFPALPLAPARQKAHSLEEI